MEELIAFYQTHGISLTAIAIIGVTLLGIMKYLKVFEKLDESVRHVLYLAISVALSLAGGTIYLLATDTFDMKTFVLFGIEVFGINQAFYCIFKTTTLQDLVKKIFEAINNLLDTKNPE